MAEGVLRRGPGPQAASRGRGAETRAHDESKGGRESQSPAAGNGPAAGQGGSAGKSKPAPRIIPTARGVAFHVLVRVERDRAFADLTLHADLERTGLDRRERALATELAYGALRWRGRLDFALCSVLSRPLSALEPGLRNLLRLGAYQVLATSGIPAAVAVSETVELGRRLGFERGTGLINAVLRQLVRRGIQPPKLADDPVAALRDWGSLPEWLALRWLRELGADTAMALAECCLEAPPRTIRLSPGADRERIRQRLGGQSGKFAPDSLTHLLRDPALDPGFARGEFTIQDEASQLVPLLLGAQPGDRVVDCCAAPGTKTVQLAQLVGPHGEVIALERSEARLPLIHNAARRLHLRNIRALVRDVSQGFDLQGQLRFRAILLDAPCSGLGTLRRNPDARWVMEPDSIPRSAERALALLESAARYVVAGGVLVYSVCTMTPEETSDVVQRFLAANRGFRAEDAAPLLPAAARELLDPDGALRTRPDRHMCDGFFAQRLVRV